MKIIGHKTFLQRVGERPRVLLRIDTDAGISGWGEAFNHGPDRALPPAIDYFLGQVAGQDPRRIEFIMQKLARAARFPQGALGLAAFGAIDLALWDISTKAAGLPVYMLLGGNARDRIQVYGGVAKGPGEAAAARDMIEALHGEHGVTAVELHPMGAEVHSRRWGQVVDELGAFLVGLREHFDDAWEFAVDIKGIPGDVSRSVRLADAIADADLMFLEEPMQPWNIPAWAALRAKLGIPLATGYV